MNKLFTYLVGSALLLCSCKKELLLNPEEEPVLSSNREGEVYGEYGSSPFAYCEKYPGPIGGGDGYPYIIQSLEANIIISSSDPNNFKSTVESAPAGSVIYIKDELIIDVTNMPPILVPGNITIASGRGNNGSQGAMIYAGDIESGDVFQMTGNHIRFTGLRLRGPWQSIDKAETLGGDYSARTCIRTFNYDALEVDNCAIYGWPYAGVAVGPEGPGDGSNDNNLHNNYFYNNIARGLGYPVVVCNGSANISANIFKNNRHSIASSGYKGSSYEASCNNVLAPDANVISGVYADFDVHGENVNSISNHGPMAGKFFWIHHNRFYASHDYNIDLGGKPENQCRIENNIFTRKNPTEAIVQRNNQYGTENHWGNILAFNNIYNNDRYIGTYLSEKWSHSRSDNVVHIAWASENKFWYNIGSGTYAGMRDYTFGDFDGDGKTDILKNVNSAVTPFVAYAIPIELTSLSQGMNTGWGNALHTTGYYIDELFFGEFTGDAKTDMFLADGSEWLVSSGCAGAWSSVANSAYQRPDISIGRYNNDNQTDVFFGDGTEFLVSNSGVPYFSTWNTIATSSHIAQELYTEGDFDGDGHSDVFLPILGEWHVAFNPNGSTLSSWAVIATSSYPLSQLHFGDINRDNKTDVIVQDGPDWYVSLSTSMPNSPGLSSAWKRLDELNFPRMSFPYGDLH